MLRHLGLIAVCAFIVASVGCDGGPNGPTPPTVTVEFGGRVVNADTGGPVANVQVSVSSWSSPDGGGSFSATYAKETAKSRGDGTFTLPVTLPRDWRRVSLKFTGLAGYDDVTHVGFGPTAATCGMSPCWGAADRPAIRMYPTLVITPGESIEVRVDSSGMVWCGHPLGEEQIVSCRRVVIAAPPGDPVELEVVAHDSSKPMALGFTLRPEDTFSHDPDMSVRRLMVPAGAVPYVLGVGTATLTARR